MHELSIALSIVDLVTDEADRRSAKIDAVHLKLGPLSGVVPAALQSAWQLAAEGSTFPEARLIIENVPIVVKCPTCNADRPAKSMQHLCCSVCGTPTPEIITGRELEIIALEISDESSNTSGRSAPESAQAK